MQMSQQTTWNNSSLVGTVKSFLLWSFTLTVCFLVVGFPLVFIIITIGALAAVILQSILPASAVLLVSGSILSVTVLGIFLSAAVLTVKGIHPQEVKWLHWLHGEDKPNYNPVYAACPLTCNLTNL